MPSDVVVVGGGPAGALAAVIMARAGLRVRLFERDRFPRPKLCGDTLNPGAMRVLERHGLAAEVVAQALPLEGMVLTGPGGVSVRGLYGLGQYGRAITRRAFDDLLLRQALDAGVQVEEGTAVTGLTRRGAAGRVDGVVFRSPGGAQGIEPARVVVACDGRASRLARAERLARTAVQPRRWAIGGYVDGAQGVEACGEMHVRAGHYMGVAPVPGGLTNVCLVAPRRRFEGRWRDPAGTLMAALAADPWLGPRFRGARLVAPPSMLGPMAVDVDGPGTPGLLLAGDAAGFIDPITGDGLRLALHGAALAADVAFDVLRDTMSLDRAAVALQAKRRRAFAAKWRFNRGIRWLVASPPGLTAAAAAARGAPGMFAGMIRFAGDCRVTV